MQGSRRRIQVLPDTVANQIAAGEVVERPASVVKELVENALDAGASAVQVHLEGGGKRKIRVADDGHGMGRADALLCLDRHATSKITAAEELESVASFGFRGEALPSIAAVSRLTLESYDGDGEAGTSLRSTGGRILDVTDHIRQRGTTVEVNRLFFNAPARAKFLKAVSAETRAVSEALTTLALAHPAVALGLVSDSRTLLDLPAGDTVPERLARIWGDEVAGSLLRVSGEQGGWRLEGWIQRPDTVKPGIRRSHLFVNGRPFRDARLIKALDRGYRTTVVEGFRPWAVVYLHAPRGGVDVNVHPAKAEVRFRDAGVVERWVEETIRDGLADEASAARIDTGAPTGYRAGPGTDGTGGTDRTSDTGGTGVGGVVAREAAARAQMALFVPELGAPDARDGDALAGMEIPAVERPRLWQVHRMYILAETRDGLLIIDQHSAHERVLFERLMDAYGRGGETTQRLLFPLTIRLTPEELAQVEEVQSLLLRAGFEVEAFGRDTVIVQGVPNPHPWFDAERCFREMVEELTQGTSDLMRSARNQHERIAMTFACKSAIKAGQKMSENEMHELFDALFATELPHHDVHGRPTIVRLSSTELERKFGR